MSTNASRPTLTTPHGIRPHKDFATSPQAFTNWLHNVFKPPLSRFDTTILESKHQLRTELRLWQASASKFGNSQSTLDQEQSVADCIDSVILAFNGLNEATRYCPPVDDTTIKDARMVVREKHGVAQLFESWNTLFVLKGAGDSEGFGRAVELIARGLEEEAARAA